jgi:hypothetical protein
MLGDAVSVCAFAALGVVLVLLVVVARWMRRRGSAGQAIGAAMAAYDEALHTTAHASFVEMQEQKDRPSAVPPPGAP